MSTASHEDSAKATAELQHERQRREYAEQVASDQELLRRKAEMDYNRERRKIQSTLETTLSQLSNSQQDVVDRALMANLICSYFQRRRSLEVLRLIGGVLQVNHPSGSSCFSLSSPGVFFSCTHAPRSCRSSRTSRR